MVRNHRFKVDKLIRDKLPEIMRSKGLGVFKRVMDDEGYINCNCLKNKLLEEASEVLETKTQADIKEELADLLEVMITLSHLQGLSFYDIEEARVKKKNDKGGLDGRIYNAFVEMESSNQSIAYYLARPDKYPEAN